MSAEARTAGRSDVRATLADITTVARPDLAANPARAFGVRVDELEAVLVAALPHLDGSPAGHDVAERARAALNRAPDPPPLETPPSVRAPVLLRPNGAGARR